LCEENEYRRSGRSNATGIFRVAKILVRYYGMLHDITGKRSESIIVEDSVSALDLVRKISVKNGKKFEEFVYDPDGKLREGLAFAIDGSSVQKSQLAKTKTKDISEFVILPPISGGVLEAFNEDFSTSV
jgi:molybdopterin converting factor small subunit